MADTPLVILGVDPGSQRTGWGIIAEQSGVLRLVDCGIIRTTSSGEKEFSQRLAVIYRQLADVVGRHRAGLHGQERGQRPQAGPGPRCGRGRLRRAQGTGERL